MFRKALKKKRTLVVLGAVAILAVAGAAIAYWTTTGSGEGSGSVASSNGTITLHGTISDELVPACPHRCCGFKWLQSAFHNCLK